MSMAERRAELLEDVIVHAAAVLADLGIDKARADHCSTALADYLAEHWGGQVISIPVDHAVRMSRREREILLDRQAGMSPHQIATKYKMTESGVRKMLRRSDRRNAVDAQIDLFASE